MPLSEALLSRERLLETIATAANALLTIDNFDDAVNSALQIIGESLDTDRVVIIDHFDQSEQGFTGWRLLYEWNSFGTISQISHPTLARGSYEGIERLNEMLSQGSPLSWLLEDMPEPFRSGQAELGVKSTHVIPIFIEGKFWGSVGFDDCREAKQRSQAELAVLKIAANCIGSAIERKRSQQAHAAIVREQEKAAQVRAAQLIKANQVLKKTLDVLATEPKLDRSLGHVLKVTTEQLGSPSAALWLFKPDLNRFSLSLVYLNGNVIAAIPENAHLLTGQWIRGQDLSCDLAFKTHISKRVPVLYDIDSSPEISSPQRQFMEKLGVKLLLGVPLLLGTEIIGSFTVRFTERRHFQLEELELVQALAHQATLAIQLLRLSEEAKQTVLLEERNRMAREIHDTLAQGFAGIIMQLQAATRFMVNQPEQAQIHLTRAQNLATESLADARRSIWLLYQEQAIYSDLQSVIAKLTQQMPIGTDVQIDIEVQGTSYSINPEVGAQLTRIVQESLNNILRHAKARNIKVLIKYELKQLHIYIQDDGCGFDRQNYQHGFGLKSMQQRADLIEAQLQISSLLGVGTQIIINLNVKN